MTPTLESLALARVRETFPNLQRFGFRRAVLKVEPEIEPGEINFQCAGWQRERLKMPRPVPRITGSATSAATMFARVGLTAADHEQGTE
jgi:hypothetical protein